jgi:type II secretory pathway component PulF
VADTLDRDGSLAGGLSQARLLGAGLLQVLRVAEGAGQLAPALQQIATSEEQRCLRLRALRAKLWLPWLVLLIGLLAGSLVRLQMPQHSIAALVLSAELTQLLGSAEFAGRLAPALEHYLGILQQRLELATASLFAWLPRIYYVLVFLVALDCLQP